MPPKKKKINNQSNTSYEKEILELYDRYINNCAQLEPLKKEIEELKEEKYKKDKRGAKLDFGLWLAWSVGIYVSIALRLIGFPDVSIIMNIVAASFLVPSLVSKIVKFPQKQKYIEKKVTLREKINSIEEENKSISETLLHMKNYKNIKNQSQNNTVDNIKLFFEQQNFKFDQEKFNNYNKKSNQLKFEDNEKEV